MNELWMSPVGNGKTERVLQQFPQAVILLTSSMSEDVLEGIPFIKDGKEFRAMPPFLQQLWDCYNNNIEPVLFLDELDKARQSVSDTLLSLVQGGYCASGKLPSNTKIIAAVNPPEWGGGDGLSEALLNRFVILDKTMDNKSLGVYLAKKYNQPIAQFIINEIKLGNIKINIKGDATKYTPSTTPRSIENAIKELIGECRLEYLAGMLHMETAIIFKDVVEMYKNNKEEICEEYTISVNRSNQANVKTKKILRV